ncbi:MAG TPA: OmpA family protein [Patescibacteria group bacterium]|nr:OmpA family protein [Patescibacteria group bacterium]
MNKINYMITVAAVFALGACSIFSSPQDNAKRNTFVVFFDFDRSNLSEHAAKTLQQVADSATQGNVTNVNLLVHTDAAGQDSDNQALSDRRAAVITAELVKDGVPAAKITSSIFREPDQLAATADGVHEPQNRRTEIILK